MYAQVLFKLLVLLPSFVMGQLAGGDVGGESRIHSCIGLFFIILAISSSNHQRREGGARPVPVAGGCVYIDTGSGQAFCGGSLISESWVMTAAHCVHNMKGFRVVLGAHRLPDETEPTRQVFLEWSNLTLKNDIALLRLPKPAQLHDNVATIPLASVDLVLGSVGSVATVSGWGLQSDKDQSTAEYLQFVRQKIISNSLCNLYYMFRIKSTHMCMSGVSGKSTCQGDSGGPLIVPDPETPGGWRQVGIVSFGIAFGCEVGWPGVFTRVSSYTDFIGDVTGIKIDL